MQLIRMQRYTVKPPLTTTVSAQLGFVSVAQEGEVKTQSFTTVHDQFYVVTVVKVHLYV